MAEALGNQPNALGCTGTAQATAAVIKTTNTELVPSSANTGAILQASAKVGTPYFLFNSQSTSAVVYPPTGGAMNGTTNGGFTIAQNKAAILWQFKTTTSSVDSWAALLTA
jgi:hypothetical protein